MVIDGLYSWDELKILQEEFGENFKVIAILTDKKLRYERISKRDFRPLTEEKAKYRDVSEIENMAKGGPIAYADYFAFNDGTVEDLKERLSNILKDI